MEGHEEEIPEIPTPSTNIFERYTLFVIKLCECASPDADGLTRP